MTEDKQLRVAAVINPAAGGDGARALAVLQGAGACDLEVLTTTAPGDAANIAYKLAAGGARPDVVVAVGGDGTVAEVAAGLHRAGVSGIGDVPPLLVAPAGTGNSVYRGLWNDADFAEAAGQALAGRAAARVLDLAVIEQTDHVSLLGSGSGLFAATLVAARNRPEKGRDLLMAAALAAMEGYVPYPGRVRVDGTTVYEGGIVETITGGFRYRGGLLRLVPDSVLDDGLLDITIVTAAADMNAFARAALGGHVYEVPGILAGRGTSVSIERTDGQPILYEHDGELMPEDMPSYDLRVLSGALTALTAPGELAWFGGR